MKWLVDTRVPLWHLIAWVIYGSGITIVNFFCHLPN
jgi:hypothetical protein